jgi:hypothetical protein
MLSLDTCRVRREDILSDRGSKCCSVTYAYNKQADKELFSQLGAKGLLGERDICTQCSAFGLTNKKWVEIDGIEVGTII